MITERITLANGAIIEFFASDDELFNNVFGEPLSSWAKACADFKAARKLKNKRKAQKKARRITRARA